MIAPRHPERAPAVMAQARSLGVPAKKLSELKEGAPQHSESALILDKMGVLSGLYAGADVVFIGGSLVPIGGHNPAEAAFFGKPVLFGPWMQNFKEMAEEFVRCQAARRVFDAAMLENEILTLAEDPALRRKIGEAAQELVRTHQGAAERNSRMVLPTLKGVF